MRSGAGSSYADMPVVRVDRPATPRGNDYRFSSLVLGVVNSMPFQMRIRPSEAEPTTDGSAQRAAQRQISNRDSVCRAQRLSALDVVG